MKREKRREEKNLTKKQGKYNAPCLFEINLRKREEGTNAPSYLYLPFRSRQWDGWVRHWRRKIKEIRQEKIKLAKWIQLD